MEHEVVLEIFRDPFKVRKGLDVGFERRDHVYNFQLTRTKK
jgi:hypothetical protein